MFTALTRFLAARFGLGAGARLEHAREALDAGDAARAESLVRPLTDSRPGDPEVLLVLAVARLSQADAAEAERLLARAAAIAPDHPRIAYNLGLARASRGSAAEACRAFERATQLDPDHAPSWFNLGVARREAGDTAGAVDALRHASRLEARDPGIRAELGAALGARGTALARDKHWSDAADFFAEALELLPDDAPLHNERANVLTWLGRMSEAAGHYREVMRIDPSWPHSAVGLLGAMNYLDIPARDVFDEHRRIASGFVRPAALSERLPAMPREGRRIRIGYYSPDLRRHPVGWLFAPVIEGHDRTAFEVFCYFSHPTGDELTARIRAASDHWRDCVALDDTQLAATIAADRLDLLVDLAGYTAGGRPALFAARPAPIQASWLGYFNTTGLDAIDWFVTDPHSSPEGQERWFREKLWRLPETRFVFAAPGYLPEPGPLPAAREGRITFGCCNHLGKIQPRVLALWSRVLAAVPGSRLLLQTMALDDARRRDSFLAEAARAGIEASRLELRAFLPPEQAARVYHEIDIALDPFPFAGGQNSLDALWMGVPLVTLPGDLIASRQGHAFLANLGLERLSAADGDGYVRIAADLAADPGALAALRASLRERMRASPLCDVPRFTRHLEAAWRGMLQERPL